MAYFSSFHWSKTDQYEILKLFSFLLLLKNFFILFNNYSEAQVLEFSNSMLLGPT